MKFGGRSSSNRLEEVITKWLIDEGFEVKKLDPRFPIKTVWGIDVRTPPPMTVGFSIFKPAERTDRFVILLGVAISPEHLTELSKLKPTERLKFMSRLMLEILKICPTCHVVVEPNPISPRGISTSLTILEETLRKEGRNYLLNSIYRIINTFIAIISYFNEAFPEVTMSKTQQTGGKTTLTSI